MSARPEWLRCETCRYWEHEPPPALMIPWGTGWCRGLPFMGGEEPTKTCPDDYCALWSDEWPRGSMRTETSSGDDSSQEKR